MEKLQQTEGSYWYMLGSKIQSAEASAEYVKTAAHLKKPLLNLRILFYLVQTNAYKQLANVFIFKYINIITPISIQCNCL